MTVDGARTALLRSGRKRTASHSETACVRGCGVVGDKL